MTGKPYRILEVGRVVGAFATANFADLWPVEMIASRQKDKE